MFEIEKSSPQGVSIQCDPEVIDDLIMILSKLLDIARYVKNRKKAAEAEAKARDSLVMAARCAQFEAFSAEVYQRYLLGPKDRSQCITQLRAEFGLDAFSIGLYISEGRRLEKAKTRARIREEFSQGMKITQLQKKYGLSYQTIRRAIDET